MKKMSLRDQSAKRMGAFNGMILKIEKEPQQFGVVNDKKAAK